MNVVDRFLKYISYESKSNPTSNTVPTTESQLELAKVLGEELRELGLSNVSVDENGYVMGALPGNIDKDVPVVGFVAHMDTAPDMDGVNKGEVKFVENYDGNDIVLNEEKGIVLSPKDFPEITRYKGQTLITTDGTTLLGADDKAGIAEIISAIEYLKNNPDIKHGTIKVAFTPDEEVGKGADHFDVAKFGADFAYTVDGGVIGEIQYENFNAAGVSLKFNGRNVHPGTAKNKMINSAIVANELLAELPADERPEHTEGYEGFFLVIGIKGTVEETEVKIIIRDHDKDKYEQKKDLIQELVNKYNDKYGANTVECAVIDQYFNMKEKIEPEMHIVETAIEAMKDIGIEPVVEPVRGGTDGARLSFMGLPTPNIFTGGHNFHGKYEYIPVESMEKCVELIVKISEKYAQK